jgi:hypothetical protein
MSTDRDTARIVRSWLEEGVTTLPDRVLDNVLDQLPATPQRRSWRPAWRFHEMNSAARFALAAAAVAVVAVVGINLLPGSGGIGGQVTNPSSTISPSPTISPTPVPIGASRSLEPNTTYLVEDPVPYTIRVPDGWQVFGGGHLVRTSSVTSDAVIMALNAWLVDNVYPDPCRPAEGAAPVGPGVDDLVAALSEQFEGDAPVSDVTIDGFSGKKVELSVPDDIPPSQCNGFEVGRWTSPGGTGGNGGYIHGPGQRDTVYVLDVEGERVAIHAVYLPAAPEAERADLQAIIDTLDFQP